jgi:hypothetical protein
MKWLSLLMIFSMTGCGTLLPKKVEFFQDKVEKFPEQSKKHEEITRQAAEFIYQNTETPVKDVARALSSTVGAPKRPWKGAPEELAQSLSYRNAIYRADIRDFRDSNDQNQGKKIEGTGLFSVPYFVWIGILLVLGFIGFIVLSLIWGALKLFAMSNPPLALGLNAAQLSAKGAGKMVTQIIKGGQAFKGKLDDIIEDSSLKDQLLQAFRDSHEKAQDEDTKTVIKHLKGN